ncbi:Uncharacterised protein [uncultured Clostridium sp.]|nr:Uncharacterised protein [uncultured Clostridium sp.]SCJ49598.1 Uncharacterised protein [uncultured Clostridium sp.]
MSKGTVKDKIVKVKVTEDEREHYYKLSKVEYNNFAEMVKDLLYKYEQELKKKGVTVDER